MDGQTPFRTTVQKPWLLMIPHGKCPQTVWLPLVLREMAVGQNQWYHFGVGAPPILVYSGDWELGVRFGFWPPPPPQKKVDSQPSTVSPKTRRSRRAFKGPRLHERHTPGAPQRLSFLTGQWVRGWSKP